MEAPFVSSSGVSPPSAFHSSCAHLGLAGMAVATTKRESRCEPSPPDGGPNAESDRRPNTHPRYHNKYGRTLFESLLAETAFN